MIGFILKSPKMDSMRAELKSKGARIGDLLPVHKKVSIYLDRWVQKNFRSEGGNLKDGKWPPFKYGGRLTSAGSKKAGHAQDIGSRKHVDASAKLLQDTGALRASHLPFYNRKDAGVGSDLKYAKFHNKPKKSKLPQRRTIPKIAEIKKEVLEIFQKHVDKEAAK